MIGPATSLPELIGLLYAEAKQRLITVTILFSITAVVALAVGLVLPKRWDATTTLLMGDNSITKPLDGRGTNNTGTATDAVATQIVLTRKILRELLAFGGWIQPPPAPQPDPRVEEQMLDKLKGRIKIDSPRDGIIRINYHDSDQKRSYLVANKLAAIFVRETAEGKSSESREAFQFIEGQVEQYGRKLTEAHEKVLAYYREGQETPPPSPTADPEPAAAPRLRKASAEELAGLRAEETMLAAQVAKAAPKREVNKQSEEHARARVIELEAQLEKLRATFTDEHPDVRRVKRELKTAQDEASGGDKVANDQTNDLDDQVAQAARTRLENVRARIGMLTGRPVRRHSSSSPVQAAAAEVRVDPGMRNVGHDTRLSELLRQYESNRDVYQDLLKRREAARVSMVLDVQRSGSSLKIQEAAEMPVIPSSLRLMHLTIIGFVIALLVPIGFLLAVVALDRRVRRPTQIEQLAKVPLLVSIHYSPGKRESVQQRSRSLVVLLMLAGVFAVYAATIVIKART